MLKGAWREAVPAAVVRAFLVAVDGVHGQDEKAGRGHQRQEDFARQVGDEQQAGRQAETGRAHTDIHVAGDQDTHQGLEPGVEPTDRLVVEGLQPVDHPVDHPLRR